VNWSVRSYDFQHLINIRHIIPRCKYEHILNAPLLHHRYVSCPLNRINTSHNVSIDNKTIEQNKYPYRKNPSASRGWHSPCRRKEQKRYLGRQTTKIHELDFIMYICGLDSWWTWNFIVNWSVRSYDFQHLINLRHIIPRCKHEHILNAPLFKYEHILNAPLLQPDNYFTQCIDR